MFFKQVAEGEVIALLEYAKPMDGWIEITEEEYRELLAQNTPQVCGGNTLVMDDSE